MTRDELKFFDAVLSDLRSAFENDNKTGIENALTACEEYMKSYKQFEPAKDIPELNFEER